MVKYWYYYIWSYLHSIICQYWGCFSTLHTQNRHFFKVCCVSSHADYSMCSTCVFPHLFIDWFDSPEYLNPCFLPDCLSNLHAWAFSCCLSFCFLWLIHRLFLNLNFSSLLRLHDSDFCGFLLSAGSNKLFVDFVLLSGSFLLLMSLCLIWNITRILCGRNFESLFRLLNPSSHHKEQVWTLFFIGPPTLF